MTALCPTTPTSTPLVRRLRDLVVRSGHAYGNGHRYGDGPNWRIRVLRVGLSMLGLDEELLRHGVAREIYVMPLAANTREFLRGEADDVLLDRPSLREISQAALHRWILPRAQRSTEFSGFHRDELLARLRSLTADRS